MESRWSWQNRIPNIKAKSWFGSLKGVINLWMILNKRGIKLLMSIRPCHKMTLSKLSLASKSKMQKVSRKPKPGPEKLSNNCFNLMNKLPNMKIAEQPWKKSLRMKNPNWSKQSKRKPESMKKLISMKAFQNLITSQGASKNKWSKKQKRSTARSGLKMKTKIRNPIAINLISHTIIDQNSRHSSQDKNVKKREKKLKNISKLQARIGWHPMQSVVDEHEEIFII